MIESSLCGQQAVTEILRIRGIMKFAHQVLCRKKLFSIGVLSLCFALSVLSARAETAKSKSKAGEGESLYKVHCVLCHGTDGHSKTTLGEQLQALDLHTEAVQEHTNAELKHVILHGQKSMPPFSGQLTPAQVDQVIAYIREFGKKKK
jgi:mono/diheme cytochrome c family protein